MQISNNTMAKKQPSKAKPSVNKKARTSSIKKPIKPVKSDKKIIESEKIKLLKEKYHLHLMRISMQEQPLNGKMT
jgi:hypothetical protein